ncbi:KilA-N domain-containing protein [Salmonella enterica]|uniref:KilA-N domain-containing protein n=1 Tax=Salmonella enterica TaxID=28901 RepID=UPI0021D48D7E|nr:KilA-N domain-containing protein [Salmonella enterica]MCU7121040.1 KilA-N domain-containing protein [Salmonella enterica]
MKEITITFNGITTKLVSSNDGMFNLNRLHEASGMPAHKRPSTWFRDGGNAFVAQLNLSENSRLAYSSQRGGAKPGTWGIEQVVYAYASWISPEFHAAVIDAFTHAVNGDGKKAVKKAQSVAFINEISMDGIPSFKITRGTWAHPDIALAYAAVIDIIHQF